MAIQPLSNPQLDERLSQLPNEIFKEANILTDLRYAYERLEAEYDNELDKAYLTYKATGEGSTVKELETKARVDNYELNLQLIQAEAIFKRQENKVEQLKNKFDTCRSLIKLRVGEMGAGG